MLYRPYYARCDNRLVKSKEHPKGYKPEEWFGPQMLEKFNLEALDFDFFVDWKTLRFVNDEIWIKRLINNVPTWPVTDKHVLKKWIIECDGQEEISRLGRFRKKYGIVPKLIIYPESINWDSQNELQILSVSLSDAGEIEEIISLTINDIKQIIKIKSGGPLRIGSKGLIYAYTLLECMLSWTDSPWPGDVDLILFRNGLVPHSVLEFKKHTLNSQITGQTLSNVYPSKDKRKYDRLGIISNYFKIPILIIYYPTTEIIKQVKVERISTDLGKMKAINSKLINLPVGSNDYMRFIDELMETLTILL